VSVIAVYNMKGGVGKTTTAVNLAYLAAAGGRRVLLWDLDPQAASSFALRVRPRVAGFNKESLKSGEAFATAIKETDYDNLDVLPADFAYRKLDRLLSELGKPARVMTALLGTLGADYDAVFLDCPAGFSLIAEGIFAAADMVLVPTIPTVLSLRMVARIIKWADRSDSPSELAAFFSMVDRRKALHRRACEWPAGRPDVFLNGQVPYASIVEQMTVRRAPLPVFAARDAATSAFAEIWAELQTRLQQRGEGRRARDRWSTYLWPTESLISQLESPEKQEPAATSPAPAADERDVYFVHGFDTDGRDLQKCGYVLELHERSGSLTVVAARPGEHGPDMPRRALAEIDRCWAVEILSGAISPLAALERRLRAPRPRLVEHLVAIVGGRKLRRIGSRAMEYRPDTEEAEKELPCFRLA
jgi:cellulose biosynthesis protein BcsQ